MKLSLWIERVKNKLIYSVGMRFPYSKIRIRACRMLGYEVGKNVYFPSDLIITQNFIGKKGVLKIGNNVSIGPGVIIALVSHPNFSKIRDKLNNKSWNITIHDNVWIGAGCVILNDVTIGENSVIAAGSVVTKDVIQNTIVGGNPAKYIKDIMI